MPDAYRVLLIDDDQEHAEMVMEFLHISGSFVVDWAANFRAVWDYLPAKEYDIVLLDYRLPDGTGLDVLAEFTRRGVRLPVVMITGQGDERVAVQAIRLGASDYLVKTGEHLVNLPAVIQKAVTNHQLQLSVQRSMEQIRYQALLLNNVRDAIVVWDTSEHITYWNPAAESLFGWSAVERLGHPVADTYLSAFTPPVRDLPRDGASQEAERQFVHKSGKIIWVSSRVTVLRDYAAGGRLIGYMDVSRDITERRLMYEQIQSVQGRLAQAARLAAIGELASGVAHHINNPLTTIIADAQLLLHKLPPDHIGRESAEAIEKAGWRVQKVVQQLLDFSRPVASSLEDLSVNDTIEYALALVGEQIQSIGVTLHMSLAPDLPQVHGNARQLGDLWLNLLMLARDATADGQPHHVYIRSREEPHGSVTVEIQDDGATIPPDDLASVFDPNFYKPIGGRGTGIEMNFCNEIVRQHQGQITIESDSEHGTIFRVCFGGIA